jgi:glycosyltransferase involved in cell wall biosynthesis
MQSRHPAVSVLLPYRQAAETLEEALEGLLAETSVDLEILAVDDGSTDSGPRKLAALAQSDRRIVPLSTPGVGIARALGHALAHARGQWIARMDGDDISLPDRFALQVAALEQDAELAAVGTQVEAFPKEAIGEGMRRYVAWQNSILSPEDHAREIFVESPLCHPSVMLRRTALEAAGGFREVAWAEDYDLWLRLHARGYRLAKLPRVLLRWRNHPRRATLTDPRYSIANFLAAKAHYLAPELARMRRPVAVWGAGKTGRRLCRALRQNGVPTALFIDIDPRKIGRRAQGAPIVSPSDLPRDGYTVVVAVAARGARDLVRQELRGRGFVEGTDFVCAS